MIDFIIGMITPEVLATPITVSNQPDRFIFKNSETRHGKTS